MGCCASTHDENKTQFPCVSNSPPRLEEETVKEVLSETPNPKNDELPVKSKLVFSPRKPSFEHKLPFKETKYYPAPRASEEEISEVSEICSLSETISTTTLEDQQMQMQLQCGKFQGYNSNFLLKNSYNVDLKSHGRSPVRRADPSPPRRIYSGSSPGQVGMRRDVGRENSARRARSPANRSRPNVGRSPSARRNGPSPGRVRMVHGPGELRRVDDEDDWAGPKESLENPLVSLECFIFL